MIDYEKFDRERKERTHNSNARKVVDVVVKEGEKNSVGNVWHYETSGEILARIVTRLDAERKSKRERLEKEKLNYKKYEL